MRAGVRRITTGSTRATASRSVSTRSATTERSTTRT